MDQLTDKERAMLGFCLFHASMRIGPDSFLTISTIAVKTGVSREYESYARDWLSYAKTVQDAEKMGVTPFTHSSEASISPGNGEGFTVEQKFGIWLAQLYYITANETGLQPSEIKINEQEARKWYDDGATPYQCFRETWSNENDSSI